MAGLQNAPAIALTSSGPLATNSTLNATAGTTGGSTNSSVQVNGPTSTGAPSAVSTSAANNGKKYVIFRDDDVGFGNQSGSSLEAVDQVHIEENVPVTLAIIPHPDVCGVGNELLWNTPVNNYMKSIATNPLFEFAQHGYNHYDYAQDGPPDCSASTAGAGVPHVEGASAPYYEVGESPAPGQLVPGQPVGASPPASEFWGRPYADQYRAIMQGRDDITQAYGVTPTTFVPPWNKGDTNTLEATAALGFTWYSTATSDFNVQEASLHGITVQGESGGLIGWGGNDTAWQSGMQSVTQGTDAALNNMAPGQTFVLGYHFWSFENPDGSVNPYAIALFKQYIEHLKSRGDVLFTTLGGQQFLSSPAPAVCSADQGKTLDLFARGQDNYLYWEHSADGGSTWNSPQSLGGDLTSAPAVTSRNDGGLTVFARGSDGAVYYRDYVGGSWGPWASIGGQTPAGSAPAVASWGGGRLDVFAEGINGGLYHKSYTTTGGWSGWQSLGGTLTSGPAATSRNPGGVTVFVRGPDGGIWYRDYAAGSWGPWAPIGGSVAANTGPAVAHGVQVVSTSL